VISDADWNILTIASDVYVDILITIKVYNWTQKCRYLPIECVWP